MSAHHCDDGLADDVIRSAAASSSSPYRGSSFIARILDSEPHHMPHSDYTRLCENRSIRLTSRQDSINSMITPFASPLDRTPSIPWSRYMHTLNLNRRRFCSPSTTSIVSSPLICFRWTFHFLSVACLSLAAKMEELYVPWLLDLQILERTYVFEPKTIQRMELLVMATLKSRLLSVTPFDYLHNFMSSLPSFATAPDSFATVYSVASNIILNTTHVIDFMRFPPFVIAADFRRRCGCRSARYVRRENKQSKIRVYHWNSVAAWSGNDLIILGGKMEFHTNQAKKEIYPNLLFLAGQEMVRSCHQLMEEYLLDTCPSDGLKVVTAEPLGVLDAAACIFCTGIGTIDKN